MSESISSTGHRASSPNGATGPVVAPPEGVSRAVLRKLFQIDEVPVASASDTVASSVSSSFQANPADWVDFVARLGSCPRPASQQALIEEHRETLRELLAIAQKPGGLKLEVACQCLADDIAAAEKLEPHQL